ncbi:MAG: hypothetical protein PQJ60_01965 [Spirochaetales bacterium]|nr:hypothetical protein [Spirochaetales bacterium]
MAAKKHPLPLSLIPLILLLPLTQILFSCRSSSLRSNETPLNSVIYYEDYNYQGARFSYAPLSTEYLEETHRLDSRYFTDSAGLFPPRRPCVISFVITLPEAVEAEILYEDALLIDEEGNSYISQSREDYYDLWEDKIALSLRSKINWLFDHNIHKKVIILSETKRREGYFIFLMNSPRRGDFLLTLPIVINNVKGTLSLPLTLNIDPYESENVKVPSEPVFTPE